MANSLIDIYAEAGNSGIDVDWFSMLESESLSVPMPDGTYCVAIDPWKMETVAQETVCVAHELGHCMTKSFYNECSKFDIRQKHENRADKWAIKKLIPKNELDAAVADGRTEIWELAEYFCVTEAFMKKAIMLYSEGHL